MTIKVTLEAQILRIATYTRTSTIRQEKEGTIESQNEQCYEKAKSEYSYVKQNDIASYKDDGWSGSTLERPGMDELLASIKEDLWDVLIVPDPDRLARDPHMQLFVIEEIEKAGKKVQFCTIDSPDSDNEDQLMMFELRGMLAKYEKVRINSRFRTGKLRKAKKHIMLSEAPYGYRLHKKHEDPKSGEKIETHITINLTEAKYIKLIFSWYVHDKLSMRQIATKLKDVGAKPRKNEDGNWNTSTIGNILKNTTYIGKAQYRRTEAILPTKTIRKLKNGRRRDNRTSRKLRPEDQWMSVVVPAILEKQEGKVLFLLAQQQRGKNAQLNPRNRKNDYLLGGKIYCTCGSARTGEGPQGGKYLYYRCGGRHNNQSTGCSKCNLQAVNARIADEKVWDIVLELIAKKTFLRKQLKEYYAKQNDGDMLKNKIADVQEKIGSLNKRVVKLKRAVIEEELPMAQYSELRTDVDEQIGMFKSELRGLTKKSKAVSENLITENELELVLDESITQLHNLNFEGKRSIVEQLIDEVVGKPGHLTVTGYIGLSSSSEHQEGEGINYSLNSSQNHVKYKTISRNCWSTQRWKINFI